MNKWKIVFWRCLTLLLIELSFSTYAILDQAVSLTYQQNGYNHTENDLDQLIELVNTTNLSKWEVKQALQKHRWAEMMNLDADTITLERVSLIFDQDSLTKIVKEW